MPDTANSTPTLVDYYIGRNLRNRRESLGLSARSVGKAIGVSDVQVHKYEAAANRLSASTLFRITRFLEISIDELFDKVVIMGRGVVDQQAADWTSLERQEHLRLARESVVLAAAFESIIDRGTRQRILEFSIDLANEMPAESSVTLDLVATLNS